MQVRSAFAAQRRTSSVTTGRIRRALDDLDRVEIALLESSQLEVHAGLRTFASGERTYRGATSSAGRNSLARAACKRAWGWWISSSSGGRGPLVLERRPIPDRPAPDDRRSRLQLEVGRREHARAENEDLAAASVDDRVDAFLRTRKRLQGRDAGDRQLEREPETLRDREADPRARKTSGPVPTTSASRSAGEASAFRSSSSTSSNKVRGTDVRSPSTRPSSTSALVATSVAVSKARRSIT